jgi:hypothetical protein
MIITKLAETITKPDNIPRFHKLAGLLYVISIILILFLPYLSEKDGIVEKMLRNSEAFGSNYSFEKFETNSYEFLQNFMYQINNNKYLSKYILLQRLFENINVNKEIYDVENEKIYSFYIPSIVNERNKYVLLTFIYDSDSSMIANKNLYLVYNLLKYFENQDNYRWISKDLKILLISKDIYYNKPKSLLKIIKESSYFTETRMDFALNFEIDDDIYSSENIVLGITGKNSENVDLDFYKLIADNLSTTFLDQVKTYDDYLSEDTRNILEKVFRYLDESFVKLLSQQLTNKPFVQYDKYFLYFIENSIDTFLKPKPLDFNHLLISDNINSISIKSTGNPYSRIEMQEDKNFLSNYHSKLRKNFHFFEAIERILKGMNVVEIQIFRGNYNYFLTSSSTYIPFEFIFPIPLLAGIHLAYKVLENLQKMKFDKVNKSKITTLTAILFFFYLFLFLQIENYSNLLQQLNFPIEEYYLFIIFLISSYAINIIVFKHIIKFNRSEFKYFETLKMFLVSTMSYNIFMINYGIGAMTCLLFYSFESIYHKLTQKYQRTREKIFLLLKLIPDVLFIYMPFAEYDEYFYTIVHNYMSYFNHTYFLFAMFYVLSVFNVTCTAISIRDKFHP